MLMHGIALKNRWEWPRVSSTLTFGTTHFRHEMPLARNKMAFFLPTNGDLWPRCGRRFLVLHRENLWQFRTDDRISSSPVILGDQLYFGDQEGFFYSLERFAGNLDWRLSLNAPIEVSPVFARGRFYVRTTDGWLHAIDRR